MVLKNQRRWCSFEVMAFREYSESESLSQYLIAVKIAVATKGN